MLIFLPQGNVNTCKEKDIDLKQMSQKTTSKPFLWLSERLMKSAFSSYETVNLTFRAKELYSPYQRQTLTILVFILTS
jgi:hypothetical protein